LIYEFLRRRENSKLVAFITELPINVDARMECRALQFHKL